MFEKRGSFILVDPRRIELPNLSDANRTLSQLSYGPILTVFQSKKVMKNGFLRYSILREKSEISNEKLEGKIEPVMEVHMDANRTLSQLSYGPILAIFHRKKL